MPHSDARKTPWYLDLTPSEMEAAIAMVPALLAVAKAARMHAATCPIDPVCPVCDSLADLSNQHPDWRGR